MGWNCLSIPKFHRCKRWSFGIDKYFHPTLYNGRNYFSMLGWKLKHVSKIGPRAYLWAHYFNFRTEYVAFTHANGSTMPRCCTFHEWLAAETCLQFVVYMSESLISVRYWWRKIWALFSQILWIIWCVWMARRSMAVRSYSLSGMLLYIDIIIR